MQHVAVNPWVALAYLVAGVCFILALRGLSSPATSRRGNRLGMIGMAIALVATIALSVDDMAELTDRWLPLGLLIGSFRTVQALLEPLTEALAVIHHEQCFHRDIAPDNVILLKGSNRPLLLDFGAARRVIGDMTQALTVILKPGYAPL